MRTSTVLLCCVALHLLHASATAQALTQWHPRPTFGVGAGVADDGAWSDGRHVLLSGTVEVPIAEAARIRVEAGRSSQPIRDGARSDVAHISRLTIGLAALRPALAPLVPYGGVSIGVYRATFDRTPETRWRRGGHVHAGIEVRPSDRVTVAGEVGLHVIPRTLYPEGALLGELLLRVKFGV